MADVLPSEAHLVGAVVIGRNEGERLRQCLLSLRGRVASMVYVDSQSEDDSVTIARAMGVNVVELDLSVPFTAARARNEGFARLLETAPHTAFVQFVDGDCEVVENWIEVAGGTLSVDTSLVAVTGVRRERYPERSIFNELCDVEWRSGTFGETNRFGGDVMIRADALTAVGGYNPLVIAAEDDEVALRLYQRGGKILRIDQPMTLHDAAMHRVSQWWRRAKRAGYGYAQVSDLHGAPPANKFKKEKRRVLTWGGAIPIALLGMAPFTWGFSLLILGAYPLRAARTAFRARREGMSSHASAAWGVSCTVSCFPELAGLAKFHMDRLLSRAPRIIEYKGPKT